MSEPDLNPAADSQHDSSVNREGAPAQQPQAPAQQEERTVPGKQDPLIGQHLTEDYLVLDRLGAGGMAIVYKARHLKTDRIVAVKTLRERDPAIMERFYREVQTLAKLKHKNIVEALDCIRTDLHHTFLVMEYLEGITLETLLRTEGRVEKAEDIASILGQVCDALEHAHQLRIIHRDLKPANIVMMVDENSEITAKVLDFGIAKLQDDLQKLTSEGQALGSPLYMSPEQCMGHDITPASDVYSLGILSYQLITGELPYKSSKMLEIMSSHCNPDVWPQSITDVRPDLPAVDQLNQIIFHALATKLDDRFQTIGEFGKAISNWIQTTRGGMPKAPMKVQMARIVTSSDANAKEAKAIRDLAAKKQAESKKAPAQTAVRDQHMAMLKVASFIFLAMVLTGGLSILIIRYKDSINFNGFVEASRFVSNVLAPVKPKDEQPTPAEPQSEPDKPVAMPPVVDQNASAPIEITGETPVAIPKGFESPVRRLQQPELRLDSQ